MNKNSLVNDLYHASVLIALSVGYSILSKKLFKIASSLIQKFYLENTAELVVIAAGSEMTMEYLIKQKILPEKINV